MSPHPAAETLRLAAAHLTPDTWCQHVMATPDGRRCAVGHLRAVAGRTACGDAYDAVLHAIEATPPHASVSEWNDAAGRTADEVRALFLDVAARLEATA